MDFKIILLSALGFSIGIIIYQKIKWIIVKNYYDKKKGVLTAILEVDTLINYSNNVIKLNKHGFELIYQCIVPFSQKKYKAIFKLK
jgi:hypothetical protein